jgi:hypothetical protein
LHCLRVSLLTGLAVYGKVKLEILQKLAGHKSLQMTVFYAKFGPVMMHQEMEEAARRMAEEGEHSVVNFLKQLAYDKIAKNAVLFDPSALKQCVPVDPTDRNPINWVRVHGGMCMVGCNTCPRMEFNKQVNGCHNGGSVIQDHATNTSGKIHESVPVMSCAESLCRWFITAPGFLEELKHWLNIKLSHLPSIEKHLAECSAKVEELQTAKTKAEDTKSVFTRYSEYREAHQLFSRAETDHSALVVSCENLMYAVARCLEVLPAAAKGEQSLVSFGAKEDVQVALKDVNSELLVLSGIMLNAKLYPALKNEYGEIVRKQSRLLDRMLHRNFGQPLFFNMDDEVAIAVANELIKGMVKKAQDMHSDKHISFEAGLEAVCKMSEAPMSLPEEMKATVKETLTSAPILKLIGKQTLTLK